MATHKTVTALAYSVYATTSLDGWPTGTTSGPIPTMTIKTDVVDKATPVLEQVVEALDDLKETADAAADKAPAAAEPCAHCGCTYTNTNLRGGVECSGCGSPR